MAMGADLILWMLQTIPSNVMFTYNLTQFGEFFVASILSIRVAGKSNMIESEE